MDTERNPVLERSYHKFARRFPNIIYPRFEGWYTNWTWLSPATGKNQLFQAQGGENWTPLTWGYRAQSTTNASARSLSGLFYPAWPYERLTGSDGDNDSIVGIDHMHMPLDLYQDLDVWSRANWKSTQLDSSTMIGMIRTLAWKHTFTIGNNSKHTLIIAYRAVPDYGINSDTFVSTQINDMRRQGFTYVTIPGVMDSGDKTIRRSFTITQNMAKDLSEFYVNNYDTRDLNTSTDSITPWQSFRMPGTDVVNPITGGNPYLATPTYGEAGVGSYDSPFSVPIQIFAKYLVPVNVGTSTTGGSGGELTGTGFSIHVSSAWKMDWLQRTEGVPLVYPVDAGPRIKAFPSQAV